MSEMRRDPLGKHWVILSSERADRPTDYEEDPLLAGAAKCPFCPGNEEETPPEIFTLKKEDSPANREWQVRVVPNKYPAFLSDRPIEILSNGEFEQSQKAWGHHEVIIETPRHNPSLEELTTKEILFFLKSYQKRMAALEEVKEVEALILFKNHGPLAGASLIHPHSQLVALPLIPKEIGTELAGAEKFYHEKKNCIYCQIIKEELSHSRRVVQKSPHFLALVPYAPRSPYEILLLPRSHQSQFSQLTPSLGEELASFLHQLFGRLFRLLGDFPYNYFLHSGPNWKHSQSVRDQWPEIPEIYHWHLEIIPRLTRLGGFEWGSGHFINPIFPEEAAKKLREI